MIAKLPLQKIDNLSSSEISATFFFFFYELLTKYKFNVIINMIICILLREYAEK